MNGKILVIGGSKEYTGAPYFVAKTALRCGADLSYIIAPSQVAPTISSYSPDIIVHSYPGSFLNTKAIPQIEQSAKKASVITIGNGNGANPQTIKTTKTLLKKFKQAGKKTIIDADALRPDCLEPHPNTILTPHAGEFERISGINISNLEIGKKKQIIHSFAKTHNCTILVKGRIDIISNGKQTHLNKSGTGAMTKAGTGDVLAGMCAAFFVFLPPFEAARHAAYLNGKIGEAVYSQKKYSLLASDLIEAIPTVSVSR